MHSIPRPGLEILLILCSGLLLSSQDTLSQKLRALFAPRPA